MPGTTIDTLRASYPSHSVLLTTLGTLLTATSTPFIYVTDPYTSRITSDVLRQLLSAVADSESENKTVYAYACINAVAAFTPRLLYDTALNSLAGHVPQWEDGCANWSMVGGVRYNESMDGFVWGMKDVYESLRLSGKEEERSKRGRGKGKGKAREEQGTEVKMVLVVERAERLSPELIVPLTRLAELTKVPITTILTSPLPWYDTRPPLGAAPDPFYIPVGAPSKESTLHILSTSLSSSVPSSNPIALSQDTLQSLHTNYLSTLQSVCAPFVADPDELAYMGAALWPAFISELSRLVENEDEDEGEVAVSEEIKMRLIRSFAPKFRQALEVLYPRLKPASYFLPSATTALSSSSVTDGREGQLELTRMEKYVLIAAFLASTNPAKSDMRMVYRGSEGERKKRRRRKLSVMTSPRKREGAAVKIPQRLLGPTTFPLDRMLAIMGNLMIEHEEELDFRGEGSRERAAEVEVERTAVLSAITSLTQSHLLTGTWPTYKCAVGYDAVLGLARDVGVILGERIWET